MAGWGMNPKMARPSERATHRPSQDSRVQQRHQHLTPPFLFYLGVSLFLLCTPLLIPVFSLHLHDFAARAMLTAFSSLPLPFINNIPTVRSRYRSLVTSAISSDREALLMASSKWAQKTVVIPTQRRGCHLVTSRIMREIEQDLPGFKCGLAHFFLQHTSASLTINENYDSDVQADTETFLNRVVPEGHSAPWKHTLEGPDDMPAHIKSSVFGIPITDGRLNMGTWQGIWLCEHRDHATPRKIVITMNGM